MTETPSLDTPTEILSNALRMYRDAKLLLNHDRYASATAISILAIEEMAKFMSLAGFQPLPRKHWRDHVCKQTSPTAFMLRKQFQNNLRKILTEKNIDNVDDIYKRLTSYSVKNIDEDISDEEERSIFMLAFKHTIETARIFAKANSKEFDITKQNCFYVDVANDLSVKSSPNQVTRDIAENHIKILEDILKGIISVPEK
jgi:AbiV family abortive infection protein